MGASRRVHALLLSNNFPLTAYPNFDTARVFFSSSGISHNITKQLNYKKI